MRCCIISDLEPAAVKAREVLLREGHECPISHVVSLDLAALHVAQLRPDMAVVVLSPHAETALRGLQKIRGLGQKTVPGVGPTADSATLLRGLGGGGEPYFVEASPEAQPSLAL